METIDKSIEVDAPIGKVYNQWTQFEDFPKFMDGIEAVQQIDDKHLHWIAKVGGKRKEWDAEITQQIPDERIVWRSTSGAQNGGAVNFRAAGNGRTEVMLKLAYEPEGAAEHVGDVLGVLSRKVEGDLKRFRDFIEDRGSETGAWRGEIHGSDVEPDRQG